MDEQKKDKIVSDGNRPDFHVFILSLLFVPCYGNCFVLHLLSPLHVNDGNRPDFHVFILSLLSVPDSLAMITVLFYVSSLFILSVVTLDLCIVHACYTVK